MSRLDKLIHNTETYAKQFDEWQIIAGRSDDGHCIICGFDPALLLQELYAVREALSNDVTTGGDKESLPRS